jgi:phosphoribosylformimino-5-aminoimidazole carboxamide ribotide isomerase
MTIIPVVDLLAGQVVRAVRGQRANYRPIVSALCSSSQPVEVARILCDHCASPLLYVADLDAIQGRGVQIEALRALLAALPGLTLWLDAGFADAAAAAEVAQALQVGARLVPVFGSESLRSAEALAALPQGAVLSLDRRDGQRMDPAGCWELPALWPAQVIVMTLERVGADSGPDLETLAAVAARKPGVALIGAGGLRHADDAAAAAAAGAQAWLVASALHDQRLPRVPR